MTRPIGQDRPKKPTKDFPLTAHACGQWAKKIGGKRFFFGPWRDADAALERFRKEFPYLNLGLTPPNDSITLAEVLNAYDDDKTEQRKIGRINDRTYQEYIEICEIIADVLGRTRPVAMITPLDLKRLNHRLAVGKKGNPISPETHKRSLTQARMVFRFANEILDCKVKYLRPLKPPEKRLIRQWRVARGPMMYSAAEIRTLIECADPHLKAAILLGINAGFGPGDCFALTPDHIRDNFVDFPRPKTAIQRRCPLWPETREAIIAIADGERVFGQKSTLRRPRRKWNRHMLGNDFQELCKTCSITCRGLYSLRRTFETIAKNAPVNQSCIDRIMGHERPDMSELYSQRTFDKQLLVCTNFVKRWLDGKVTL